MREILEGFLSLLAPRRCVGCDELTETLDVFCAACAPLLEPTSDPSSAFEYGGPVADAVQRFKYDRRSELGAVLGSVMAEHAGHFAGRVDAVVPVPLHWRRRRFRGYDQAALLARPVAKALGVRVLFRGLLRVKNTPQQVGLALAERRRNLDGAFEAWRLGGVTRVLLVDDVRTTGATLDAAASALRAGGASEVHSFVLATRVLA